MSYDHRNRLETVMDTGATGTRSLTYDNRGNVRTVGGLTMNYNAADRPTGLSGDVQGSHRYDGYGRRVKSIKQTPTGSVVRYNVYDSTGSLAYVVQHDHSDENDDYVMSYVNLDKTTSARVKSVGNQVNYTDSVTYLHKDHLGSASSGTDDLGHVIWTESYTPFGIALSPDAANDNQAAFTGHIRDSDTGLTYMQARYYDPVASRFLSIDPVTFLDTGEPGMFNRYAYTLNDPVNMIDPDGNRGVKTQSTVGGNTVTTITAKVIPLGNGTNSAGIAQGVADYWNAQSSSDVKFNISVGTINDMGNPGSNVMHTSDGGFQAPSPTNLSPATPCSVSSSCGMQGGEQSWIDTSVGDAQEVANHEFGHNLGGKDGYEGSTGAGAARTAPTSYNRSRNDVMSVRSPTATVGPETRQEIIDASIQGP